MQEISISYKNIIRIAAPIAISSLSTNIVSVTDTIFLTHLSESAVAGAGNAVIFYMLLSYVGIGFATGAQIIMGRRNGEGNYSAIGKVWIQTAYLLLLYGLLVFGLSRTVFPSLFDLFMNSKTLIGMVNEYINMRSWGIFFTVGTHLFVAFYVGITNTRIMSFVVPITAFLNIILDYGLIFGELGLPALGVQGAALASNISEMSTFILLGIYTFYRNDKETYGLFHFRKPNFNGLKKIMNIGSPVVLQHFVTLGSWYFFFSLIEHIGERELAISHVIRSLYMFLLIPFFGLGESTNTLVSNLLGQKAIEKIKPLLIKTSWLTVFINVVFIGGMWLFKEQAIGLFTTDSNFIIEAYPSFNIVLTSMFPFAIAIVLFRGYTGTGKTIHTLIMEGSTILIYVSYCLWISSITNELAMVWTAEYVYFGFLIIITLIFFKYSNWRTSTI